MSRFSDDYFVELLRGIKRPEPSVVRKAMSRRMAYLADKIERGVRLGKVIDYDMRELIVLARLMEMYEEKRETTKDTV